MSHRYRENEVAKNNLLYSRIKSHVKQGEHGAVDDVSMEDMKSALRQQVYKGLIEGDKACLRLALGLVRMDEQSTSNGHISPEEYGCEIEYLFEKDKKDDG